MISPSRPEPHRIVIAGSGIAAGRKPEAQAPVLRGVLGTPRGTLYLQADLGPGRAGEGSVASWLGLWPAPGRVASRWLGAYLEGEAAGPGRRGSPSASCATR